MEIIENKDYKNLAERAYPVVPRVGVGILVFKGNNVLLVKRGREPSKGKWTVPGGLVELGETLAEAAHRELREECDITVELGDIIETFDFIERDEKGRVKYHYIIVDFIARFRSGRLAAASDIDDARWIFPSQIDALDTPEKTKEIIDRASR